MTGALALALLATLVLGMLLQVSFVGIVELWRRRRLEWVCPICQKAPPPTEVVKCSRCGKWHAAASSVRQERREC